MYLNWYGTSVKYYKVWDTKVGKVLYRITVILRVVNYSLIVVQQVNDEKKLIFQLLLKNKKFEPIIEKKIHEGSNKEDVMNPKSWEDEE